MSSLSDQDLKGLDNKTIKEGTFKCSEINFRKNIGDFEFMEVKKGWIPERFKEVDKKNLALSI